jgi:hypothetical protein
MDEMKGGVPVERTSKQRWVAAVASLAIAVAGGGLLAGLISDDVDVGGRPGREDVGASAGTSTVEAIAVREPVVDGSRSSILEPADGAVSGVIDIIGSGERVDRQQGASSAPEPKGRGGPLHGGVPEKDASYSLRGPRNPVADDRSVGTPTVHVPGTCTQDVCDGGDVGEQRHATTPEVASQAVATRERQVAGRCAELVCIGSFTVRAVEASTPGVGSESVTTSVHIPSVCRAASTACMAPTDVPGQTVLVVPGVGARRLTDTVVVTVDVQNVEAGIAPRVGLSNRTGPIVLPMRLPEIGVVAVTLCPDGCVSLRPSGASTRGNVRLAVAYGGLTRNTEMAIDRG